MRLFSYPDYRHANPYQQLLYRGLSNRYTIHYIDWRGALAAAQAAAEPSIFHLHWEDAIYRMQPDEAAATAEAQAFLVALETAKAAGMPFLWTVHNEQPHDGRYAALHGQLADALSVLADWVIVHHPSAAEAVAKRYNLPAERLAIVPHGHYRDIHSPLAGDRDARRQAAGYGSDDTVLLLFGRLDAYKGGAELLAAFAALDAPNLHLVIAGKQVVPIAPILDGLPPTTRARITVHEGFVADAEIPALFERADFVVAPYREISTSGTVMLALSLGRPVIVPALPGILEWVRGGENGLVFAAPPDADEKARVAALQVTLREALDLPAAARAAMAARATATALRHDWQHSSNLLAGLYAETLLARGAPRVGLGDAWFSLD